MVEAVGRGLGRKGLGGKATARIMVTVRRGMNSMMSHETQE